MTTVAWRDGVLAADKKASAGDIGWRVTKLHRTKRYAIAFAGDLAVGALFVEWWKRNHQGHCPLNDDTTALVMDLETGACEQWEAPGVGIPIEDKFASIGSGEGIAVGAMAFGASAIEAVETACEWDNCSGLGINYATSRAHRKKREQKESPQGAR